MKKIFLFLFLIFLAATMTTVWAQSDEESLPSASPSDSIKQKIKQRLEQTATEAGEPQASEGTTAKKTKYYAFVGTLTSVDTNTLTIETDEGEKQAIVDKDTVIVQTDKAKARKEVTADKLTKGNLLIAMGTLENETLKALRVSSTLPLEPVDKMVVFGKVAESEDAKITLKNGEQTILSISDKTLITIKGTDQAKVANIQLEDSVYAVVLEKDGKISETKAIFVIPGKNNPENQNNHSLKPSVSASASATPKSSPKSSAKPKVSPSPSPEESTEPE